MENELQPFAAIHTKALHKSTAAGSIEVPSTGMAQNLTTATLQAKYLPSTPSAQAKPSPRDVHMQTSLSRYDSRMRELATNEVGRRRMKWHGNDRCKAGDWIYTDSVHSKPYVMQPLETDQPRSMSSELVELIPRPASLEARARQKQRLSSLIYDSILSPFGRVRSAASGLHTRRLVEIREVRVPREPTTRTFISVNSTPYQVRHGSRALSQGLVASGVQVSTNVVHELTHSKSPAHHALPEYHVGDFHDEAKDNVRLKKFSNNATYEGRVLVIRAPQTDSEHYIPSSHDACNKVHSGQHQFGKASTDSMSTETETSRTVLTTLNSSLSRHLNAVASPCLDSAMEAPSDESTDFIRFKHQPQGHPENGHATLDKSSFSELDRRSNVMCRNSQCNPAEFSGEVWHGKPLVTMLVDSFGSDLEGTAQSTDQQIQSMGFTIDTMRKKLTTTSMLKPHHNDVGQLMSAKRKEKLKHSDLGSSTGQQNIDDTPILSVPHGVCFQSQTTLYAWYIAHRIRIICRAKTCTSSSANGRWVNSQSVAVCFTAAEQRRIRSTGHAGVQVIDTTVAHPHLGRSAEIIAGSGKLHFVGDRLMYRNNLDYHPMGASSSYSEVPRQRFSTHMITSIQYPWAIGENIVDRVRQGLHSPVSEFSRLNMEQRDRYTPTTDNNFCRNTTQSNLQYSAGQEKIESLINSSLVIKGCGVEQGDHNRFHPPKRRQSAGVPEKYLKVPLSIVDLDELVDEELFDLNEGSNKLSEVRRTPLLIRNSSTAQRGCESAQHTSLITTVTLVERNSEELKDNLQLDADVVCGSNVSPMGAVQLVVYNVSPQITRPQKCAEPMQCIGKLRVQPSRTPDPCPFRAVQTNGIVLQVKDPNVLMYPMSVNGVWPGRRWLRIRNPPLTRFHNHGPRSANNAFNTKSKYQGGDEWSYRLGMRALSPFCVNTGDMKWCTPCGWREDALYDKTMEYLWAHELYTTHGKASIITNGYISPLPPSITSNLIRWSGEQYGITTRHPDSIHLDAQDSRYFAEVSKTHRMSHKSQRGGRQWKTCAPFGRIFRRRAASSPQ